MPVTTGIQSYSFRIPASAGMTACTYGPAYQER